MPVPGRQATGAGAGGGAFGLPLGDLDAGVEASAADLGTLAGATLLVTGGTGFLGSWLVASLLRAEERLALGLRVLVLSREPARVPLEPRRGLELVRGDVTALPALPPVDVVLHGAASSAARFGDGDGDPRAMAATIIDGTRAVLEHAAATRGRVLLLSSGAVYGPRTSPVGEDAGGGPDPMDPRSAYATAKQAAESWCASATAAGEVEGVVARLFAFVGPRLPLAAHFAAGNFLADALARRRIEVAGDGSPRRSYLYAGELPRWCFALLARARPGRAYNVGSPEALSIAELARRVGALADPPLEVAVGGARRPAGAGPPACYVPLLDRARDELGLRAEVALDDALARTYAWYAAAR